MGREWNLVKKVLSQADVVLEVVDARDPWGTRSREVEKLAERMGKPLLLVINKSDLVPREIVERWVKVFRQKGLKAVYLSASKRLGTRYLWRAIKSVSSKGIVVVAVVGLPNVGKSTIINILKGSHSVGTSPIPGYTKHVTRLRVTRWLRVLDTPGVIPKGSEEELALRSALRPEALDDPVPAAIKLVERIADKNPGFLESLYKVKYSDPYDFLEKVAVRRGLLGKGGVPRIEEAAKIVIRDWQRGKINFFLEPEDYGLLESSPKLSENA